MGKVSRKDHVTIQDIASVAGVSAMTVSRALRGASRISSATRERIRKIADEMGYRPNPMVSALMSARAGSMTVTANLAIFKVGAIRELRGFSDGIVAQAEKYGYPIQEFVVDSPGMTPERLRAILLSRGIRGIIILPVPDVGTDLHFNFEGFATVALGNSVIHERLPRIVSDAYLRVLDALKHLEARGYTRIGFVNFSNLEHRFHHGMRAAVEVAPYVISRKLKVHTCLIDGGHEHSRFDAAQRRTLRTWIKQHRLQVVMSQFEYLAEVLRDEGFEIPGDIGYLHLHSHPDPHIASMDQMCQFAGQKAVDVVVAAINRNELSLPKYPYNLSIPSIWRDGTSVPVYSDKVPRKRA